MQLLRQFESLKIDDFEELVYSYPDHAHLYYEIVYIHHGSGKHFLNNSILPYQAGDLFLLSPGDHHYFDISKSTRFTFIKFTDSYFSTGPQAQDFGSSLPYEIMKSKAAKECKLSIAEPYAGILKKTVQNIVCYNSAGPADLSQVVYFQILSLLSLVRELLLKHTGHTPGDIGAHKVLQYIQQNIYSRRMLSIQTIAAEFSIAPNYFSNWFRRVFDISFREYVTRQRNELIRNRVQSGPMTLKEIAQEFDFVDESHLIKYFKKNFGLKPSEYRAMRA